MTAAEIAETLVNGNVKDAREAIVGDGSYNQQPDRQDVAVMALDVVGEYILRGGTVAGLRRCLTGES